MTTQTITELKAEIAALKAENEELKKLVFVDDLTGCFNRRAFDLDLEAELNRCDRTKSTTSILLIDIDHFKSYNDTKGHQAGDELLSGLGNIWKATIERATDKVYRYGGEEKGGNETDSTFYCVLCLFIYYLR